MLRVNKRFIISGLITIGLLYLILKKIGIGEIIASLKEIKSFWFGLAILLMPLQIFFKVCKWHYLLKISGHSVKFTEAMKSYLGGMGIALITPAKVGELTRVLYIETGNRLKLSGLVIIDKFFDLFVVVSLAIMGLALILQWSVNIILFVFLMVLLYFLFNPVRIKILLQKIIRYLPFKDKTADFISSIDILNSKVINVLLGLTFLAFFIDFFQFYFLILSFGNVSLKAVAFSFPLIILANILPITVGGLGVREGVSVISLSLFKVAKEVAVNAAFLLFFINTFVPGIIGVFLIHKIKVRLSACPPLSPPQVGRDE